MDEEIPIIDADEFLNVKPRTPSPKPNYGNPVDEYTIDGIYIRSWPTIAAASLGTGITTTSISDCCRRRLPFLLRYSRIFLFEKEKIKERMAFIEEHKNLYKSTKPIFKPVNEYDLKGNLICKYCSIVSTADHCKVTAHQIARCCKGLVLQCKGRIFLFEDGNIKERIDAINKQEEDIRKARESYKKSRHV